MKMKIMKFPAEDINMFRGLLSRTGILKVRAFIFISSAVLSTAFAFGPADAASPKLKQRTFSSAEEASQALAAAVKKGDSQSLLAVFGHAGRRLISSGDDVADKAGRERFLKLYEEKNRLEPINDKKMILHIGNEDWPFAIPIAKSGERWRFDTREGRQEILARIIGKNELSAIQVCLAYVDAQREYALKDRDSNGLLEYAQRFRSTPGNRDGLYWEAKEGEEQSPLGPLFAGAAKEGYPDKVLGGRHAPYHGYYYRILKSQGVHATGGAYDYRVNGKMIGGFAAVAYPARYKSSGIMTFIVNQDGVVYQKNLGRETESVAQSLTVFDPDDTWKKVEAPKQN